LFAFLHTISIFWKSNHVKFKQIKKILRNSTEQLWRRAKNFKFLQPDKFVTLYLQPDKFAILYLQPDIFAILCLQPDKLAILYLQPNKFAILYLGWS